MLAPMEGRDRMRAADVDRQATAERLRVALEEGRLDLHEYDERLGRAYGAKTYAELDEVVADLPGVRPAERSAVVPAPAPAAPVPVAGGEAADGEAALAEPGRRSDSLLRIWSPWLRVAGILTAIWLISSIGYGHVVYYWPAWAIGPWGVLLLLKTVGVHDGDRRHPTDRSRRERRERRRGH
ncbi:protein of unknown function (DUF1707) [Micromonospora narathiwatensis]|uniref:DUF1707 domain-containing protein n=2 Tax=Micromonospora narathiwatensis TaxID=299146 RepID=A0A1A9A5U4_9ACTN|nr:protein of unknown function (DUF1707) [Micromonospora narathiwatensis]